MLVYSLILFDGLNLNTSLSTTSIGFFVGLISLDDVSIFFLNFKYSQQQQQQQKIGTKGLVGTDGFIVVVVNFKYSIKKNFSLLLLRQNILKIRRIEKKKMFPAHLRNKKCGQLTLEIEEFLGPYIAQTFVSWFLVGAKGYLGPY